MIACQPSRQLSHRMHQRWTIALDVALAILTTFVICLVSNQDTPFIVASKESFYDMFFNDIPRDDANFGYIYSMDECVESVSNSIRTFYDLPKYGLGAYNVPKKVLLRAKLFEETPRLKSKGALSLETSVVDINITSAEFDWQTGLGMDTDAGKHKFFTSLVEMQLVFSLQTLHRELDHFTPFEWQVATTYDLFMRGGRIRLALSAIGSHVQSEKLHWELALDFLLFAVLMSSMVWNAAGDMSTQLQAARTNPANVFNHVSHLLVLAMIAVDVGQYTGILIDASWALTRTVAGFAAFFSWCRVIPHMGVMLGHEDTSWSAVRIGVPVVLRFLVGASPLMLGFAALGMSLFSEVSEKFDNLGNSMMTLFSVMNGDVLLETATEIRLRGRIGDYYIIFFVSVATFIIMSIFISIVQDAYATAKLEALGVSAAGAAGPGLRRKLSDVSQVLYQRTLSASRAQSGDSLAGLSEVAAGGADAGDLRLIQVGNQLWAIQEQLHAAARDLQVRESHLKSSQLPLKIAPRDLPYAHFL